MVCVFVSMFCCLSAAPKLTPEMARLAAIDHWYVTLELDLHGHQKRGKGVEARDYMLARRVVIDA